MKRFFTITLLCLLTHCIWAQSYNQLNDDGTFRSADNEFGIAGRNDSVFKKNKKQEIPRNLKVWTVDERFGDITPAEPDTMHHMFMNSVLNGGLRGEYSSAGNIGTPRLNRIFIDRRHEKFVFAENYDMFIVPVENFHFTNTLSPITNISFNTCGSNDNGEDHFKALFAANAGKRFGFGIKFDYIYGKGYYDDSNTSHFGTTLWGSYLGDRYQAHLLFNTNHQKIAENGGVVNDDYITHPESKTTQYREKEIPVMLDQNWNRHDNHHIFFTHRYNVGFHRKVPMTEDEIKAKKLIGGINLVNVQSTIDNSLQLLMGLAGLIIISFGSLNLMLVRRDEKSINKYSDWTLVIIGACIFVLLFVVRILCKYQIL